MFFWVDRNWLFWVILYILLEPLGSGVRLETVRKCLGVSFRIRICKCLGCINAMVCI